MSANHPGTPDEFGAFIEAQRATIAGEILEAVADALHKRVPLFGLVIAINDVFEKFAIQLLQADMKRNGACTSSMAAINDLLTETRARIDSAAAVTPKRAASASN